MFFNPYKNRKKSYLTLELIITVGVVVFIVISFASPDGFQFSWFFLLVSLIFFIRMIEIKDMGNFINFAICFTVSVILFLIP
ncbi:Uncharacterised protein [Paenibacillus thiaminolyticus]|nr:Uncharacterised protein [Paenibacillus thiaminolyticus]